MKKSRIAYLLALSFLAGCGMDIEIPDPSAGDDLVPSRGEEFVFTVSDLDGEHQTRAAQDSCFLVTEGCDSAFSVLCTPMDPIVYPDTRVDAVQSANFSSFYLNVTKGSTTQSVVYTNKLFEKSDNKFSGGLYWPSTDPKYHFYASNIQMQTGSSSYSKVSCPENTDVVCAYLASPSFKASNNLAFTHVYARLGSVTIKTPSDNVTGTITSAWIKADKKGTYDIKAGSWSNTSGKSSQTTLSASNDLYAVPGTYQMSVTFTLNDGTSTKTGITRTGNVALTAGKVNNIIVNVADDYTYSIVVTPNPVPVKVGETVNLTATYYTKYGTTTLNYLDVTKTATWSSENTGIAKTESYSTNGGGVRVKGVAAGTVNVSASYADCLGSTVVNVEDNITEDGHSLAITNPGSTSLTVGDNVQLTATYYTYYKRNGVRDDSLTESKDVTKGTTRATWSSGASAIASVGSTSTNGGYVSAVKAGTAKITATYNGYSDSVTFTVSDDIVNDGFEIIITGSNNVKVGSTINLVATYYEYYKRNGVRDNSLTESYVVTTNSSCTWSSNKTGIATVNNSSSNKGKVTGQASGTATITATYLGISGSLDVTVEDNIVEDGHSLEVTGTNSIKVGGSTNLTATYYTYYKRNGVRDNSLTESQTVTTNSSCSWSSGNTSKATVNNSSSNKGKVTGVSSGTVTITASYNGYSDTFDVIVSDKITNDGYEIIITGNNEINVGGTTNLVATYYTYYKRNGVRDNSLTESQTVTTSASWSSNKTSVATVNNSSYNKGKVTGVSSGTATITATYSGTSGSIVVTVADSVVEDGHLFEISTPETSIEVGDDVQMTATYYTYYKRNGVRDNSLTESTDVTLKANWSSSKSTVASVTNTTYDSGNVTGKAAGTARISASYSGLSDYVDITVTDRVTNDGYELIVTGDDEVYVGGSIQLTATYYTYYKRNGVRDNSLTESTDVTLSANWSSGSTGKATVTNSRTDSGKVTGVSAGTARITASYEGKSGYIDVTVKDAITTEYDIEIFTGTTSSGSELTSLSLFTGDTDNLKARGRSRTVTNGVAGSWSSWSDITSSVTWSPTSGTYAKVSDTSGSKGLVTAIKAGEQDITATHSTYGTATCTVTVKVPEKKPKSLSLTMSPTIIDIGETSTGTVVLTYDDGSTETISNNDCSWTNATKGVFTGSSSGTTTVKASYSELSASATVTVKQYQIIIE